MFIEVNVMSILGELTKKEKEKIDELTEQMDSDEHNNSSESTFISIYDENNKEAKKHIDQFINLMTEIKEKQAEEYSKAPNIPKFITDLKSAIKHLIFVTFTYRDSFPIFEDNDALQRFIYILFDPYLEHLKKKASQQFNEIEEFIDEAISFKIKTCLEEQFRMLSPEYGKLYAIIRNGIATNNLTKLKSKKSNVKFDPLTGNGTMTWNDFTVTMKNFSEIAGFRSSTHKLLDALLIEFTETGGKDTKITLPLKKYMELRNLKDEKTARKQADEDLETLYNASIYFSQNSKNSRKRHDYVDMRLVIDKGIKRGIIQCTFHPDFYNLMNSYQVMPMAKKALALNDKHNPNAYYFLKELCEHTNMNYGKPNQNLISVATLLKSTPEIPTYKEVEAKKQGQYKQLIIEPFERDMEALEAVEAIKWEYCHSNAIPLSDEELSKMDYETFSKLLIHFELTGYPQRTLPEKPKNKVKKNTSNKA